MGQQVVTPTGTLVTVPSNDDLAAMLALIPAPATTAPPGIGVTGAVGPTSGAFARADHTHASSVQRKRLTTTDTTGMITWTYTTPYAVPPIVTATVENATNATQPLILTLVGQPTTTQAVFKLQQAQQNSQTVSLGLSLNLPFAAAGAPIGTAIHVWAALPTA